MSDTCEECLALKRGNALLIGTLMLVADQHLGIGDYITKDFNHISSNERVYDILVKCGFLEEKKSGRSYLNWDKFYERCASLGMDVL